MIRSVLQLAAYCELAICWVAWAACFVRPYRESLAHHPILRARSCRWGIGLCFLGCAIACFPVQPAGAEKSLPEFAVAIVLAPLSVRLAWSATHHLGKNWHCQAILNTDHELVTTGPYARIRHPIYASMLGMLLASAAACAWWPVLVVALVLFLVGTEIRIHTEDRLLELYFQDEFLEYRSRVWGFIPLIL
jgi:protein-S-isoprenylcysteine O-methyltransferase Ste14